MTQPLDDSVNQLTALELGFTCLIPSDKYSFEVDTHSDFLRLIKTCLSSEGVGSFVAAILEYNNAQFDQDFVNRLGQRGELALPGGLVFCSNQTWIPFSCCADISDWRDNLADIQKSNSPWMGHDPTPCINFDAEHFLVWSDEAGTDGRFAILAHQSAAQTASLQIEQTIADFLLWTRVWCQQHFPNHTESFVAGMALFLCGHPA